MKSAEAMQLVWPAEQHLASYVAVLEKGWSADILRSAMNHRYQRGFCQYVT